MKTRQAVALSLLAGLTLGAVAVQRVRSEETYVRKVPLDAYIAPVPVPVPRGSSLDLRPSRAPDSGDLMTGYTPPSKESATPSIGLSIKSPFDDRK